VAVDEAGACAMVLELIPSELSQSITQKMHCPTIGIGAGAYCDGQIQVMHDVLGMSEKAHKHAKVYWEGRTHMQAAFAAYCSEVRTGVFPTEGNSF
jgi:3-methyl-2-oxobutanoate hydroxymethyltransferase